MPYKRYSVKRKTWRSSTRASKRASSRAARLALLRQPPRQYGSVPLEKKYIDVAQATYACSTAGSVTYISGTGTGDDDSSRDGRQIFAQSIQVHGIVQPEDDTTDPCYSRVLIVLDRQPNGALATIANIFASATSTSFMNLNYRDRFVILAEWSGVIGKVSTAAQSAIAGSPTVQHVKLYKDLNDLRITYAGTTASIADASTNALLLVTIGNIAAGAAANLVAGVRMRFVD